MGAISPSSSCFRAAAASIRAPKERRKKRHNPLAETWPRAVGSGDGAGIPSLRPLIEWRPSWPALLLSLNVLMVSICVQQHVQYYAFDADGKL